MCFSAFLGVDFKSAFTWGQGNDMTFGLVVVKFFALLQGGLAAQHGSSFQSWLNFLTNSSYLKNVQIKPQLYTEKNQAAGIIQGTAAEGWLDKVVH